MNKLLKFFPLMPAKGDTAKLVWAIVFYFFVPTIAAGIIGFILGITIILAILAPIVGLVAAVYQVMGIVFAIMNYLGKEVDLEGKKKDDKADNE